MLISDWSKICPLLYFYIFSTMADILAKVRGALWTMIINIPICGGYCAPTKSPEKTCMKRFSNEATVPQPCLRRLSCRLYVFEHNTLLRLFGRIGFGWGDRNRKHIMLFAFSLSFIAWFMTISSACAYTNSNAHLRNTYWYANPPSLNTFFCGQYYSPFVYTGDMVMWMEVARLTTLV